jgi:sodium transport system permease protein
MNWRNVRLIFLREVRDQLRDRRTLFMIAVLPLLLYPALGVGMLQMTVLFNEQPRTVVVLGAHELPEPALIAGDRFASNWFEIPADADRLRVITEETLDHADPTEYQELADRLAAAESLREAQRDVERLEAQYAAAVAAGESAEARRLAARLNSASRHRSQLFSASGLPVLILVPPGMKSQLAEANTRIRERDATAAEVHVPSPIVLYNVADEKSLIAYTRVKQVLGRWESELLKERLRLAGLPESLPRQVEPKTIDLAQPDERARSLWSKLFPALLVIMTVTGAFYPAVDLAAGEKERGTMETLLICPASRIEIVLGKFFTVLLFSVCTATLNLGSMGLTGKYMASFALGGALPGGASLAPPSLAAIAWVLLLLLPLAALFSALCLSLATFARSSKEGQYYLTPLLLITVGLTVFCLSPATEITPLYSMLPVVGVALLLKELLAGGVVYVYLAPVLITSFSYAALALWWAVDQFNREDVLFREAERFELGLWLRHLLRDKEETPSFAEAGFCFLLIVLLQFGAMKAFSEALAAGPAAEYGARTMHLLIVQQIVIIATPVLLMAVMLTRNVRATLRLRWPEWKFLAVGFVLPLALMPLSATLVDQLGWFFPPLPASILEKIQLMRSDSLPLWLTLMAFALFPGVCEELAFRGFLLSGFLRSGRTWLAIGLSSLAFGFIHMIPQQVFNATLVGLVLGLLAVRSGSLWPCIVFHILFNGSQVLTSRFIPQIAQTGYPWPLLVACAIVAGVLIRWLVVAGHPQRAREPYGPLSRQAESVPVQVG